MDLVCVQTVPDDGITTLFIQGGMIELDTVFVCVCAAGIVLTSLQIWRQTPESSRMSLRDPNSSQIPMTRGYLLIHCHRQQFALRRSNIDSLLKCLLESCAVREAEMRYSAQIVRNGHTKTFRPHSAHFLPLEVKVKPHYHFMLLRCCVAITSDVFSSHTLALLF